MPRVQLDGPNRQRLPPYPGREGLILVSLAGVLVESDEKEIQKALSL